MLFSILGEFPWTVALLREEKALDGQILNVYVCGGSLIEPGKVLLEHIKRAISCEWTIRIN